ncbi:MAG: hypothetical protein HYZ12_03940 [Thaumarchaeota archaeon]|nr:hypothetical protein [Nitrososphaerota archaeon]
METYLQGGGTSVYSLVAAVPFSPIDLDLGLLARGEWDTVKDRFRIWFLPKIEGQNDTSLCYVTVRKLDPEQEVLVYMHIVINLEAKARGDNGQSNFTVGILSNDDIRARSTLGVIFGIPPVFHRRSEVRLVERKWRTDPETIMRFGTNVLSAFTAKLGPGGGAYSAKAQPPPDFLAKLKRNLDSWWQTSGSQDSIES